MDVAVRPSTPMAKTALIAVLLFLLGVTSSLVWVETHRTRIFDGTDGTAYDVIATNLVSGRGFSLESTPPFVPTMHREPGYPMFVAAVYSVFGRDVDAVARLQTLTLGALAVVTFFIAKSIFGLPAGILAGAFVGLSPDHGDLIRQIMTEPLMVTLFGSAVLASLVARKRRAGRWYFTAGALFGLAALVRVFTSVFFLPFLVVWGWLEWRERRQHIPIHLALALAGFALIVSPWVIRNHSQFGVPMISGRYGYLFLPRALKTEAPLQQNAKWARAAAYIALNPLSELVYPIHRFQYGPEVWANEVWDFHINDANKIYLRRLPCEDELRGSSDEGLVATDACKTLTGVQTVVRHPFQYAAQTVFEFVKFHFYPFPSKLALYRNGLQWLAFGALVWLLLRRGLAGDRRWLAAALAVYVGLGLQLDAYDRHAVPILPLYYSFAAYAAVVLLQRLNRWVTQLVPVGQRPLADRA